MGRSIIAFEKYQGAGNDFVIIAHEESFALNDLPVSQICDRHFGVGADGLIIVRPSQEVDYEMIYFNADGRIGSMCGNGARCAFQFARSLKLVNDHAAFLAFDGVHRAWLRDDGNVAISMADVDTVKLVDKDVYEINTGSPHYIRFVEDLANVDVVMEGRAIRNSAHYRAEGINVNFVERTSDALRMSTYERGVENMTLACGTGATAVAIAEAELRSLKNGRIILDADGGRLAVEFRKTAKGYTDLVLEGPATLVFTGIIQL